MAIDLMIMPLSRYWSGDFITPAMRECWAQGVPYGIVRPGEPVQQLPPAVPFGGDGAAAKRNDYLPVVREYLAQLPHGIAAKSWNEASSDEPVFHRPNIASFHALMEQARSDLASRPGLFGMLFRKKTLPHLVHAQVFLPVHFEEGFIVGEVGMGSLPVVKRELESVNWSDAAASAAKTFLAAIHDAERLRFPLIVDA